MASDRSQRSPRPSTPVASNQSGRKVADVWSLLLANIAGLTDLLSSVEPDLVRLSLDHKTLFLLSLLDTHDQPSTLARALAAPRPTITALVKRAESNGFLRRSAVRGDLRRFRLTITDQGRAVASEGRGIIERALHRRLEGVSSGDIQAFSRVVGAIAMQTAPLPLVPPDVANHERR